MAHDDTAQAARPSVSSPWGKCDDRMECAIPTEFKEKFEALARLSVPAKSPSELMRDLACKHVVAEMAAMGRMMLLRSESENPENSR